MHILVAEDDKVSRELLRRLLESEPRHKLLMVENGENAWQHLQDPAQNFDVCISDIQMPGLDGLGLARRIRADARLARLPIVLCTAANDRATVQQAAGLAVAGYIVKPYTRARVLEQLQRIETGSALSPAPAPDRLEDEATVRGRLGIDAETHHALLQAMLGDMTEWLFHLRGQQDAREREALLVRASGFKGACLSLGAVRAAQHLSALQIALPLAPERLPAALQELEKEIALLGSRIGMPVAA
jgi:CheY-like chemotaxis protein